MANLLQDARTAVSSWLDVPRAQGVIVLLALGFLVVVSRGFRGVKINLG